MYEFCSYDNGAVPFIKKTHICTRPYGGSFIVIGINQYQKMIFGFFHFDWNFNYVEMLQFYVVLYNIHLLILFHIYVYI